MNKKYGKSLLKGFLIIGLIMFSFPGFSQTKTVLFDEGHGQRFKTDDTESLGLSKFSEIFINEGWKVEISKTELTDELLKGVDALVISGAFEIVEVAEITAITRFLQKGGKLSVMLHIGFPVSDLLHTLHVSISNGVIHEVGDLVVDNDIDFMVRDLTAHEITKNLKYFTIYGGWALLSRIPQVYAIARTSENAWIDLNNDKMADAQQVFSTVLVGNVGSGEFVVFSDDAIFQNHFLSGHNHLLAENLVKWLAK